jgi:hypothetical protein
MSASEGEISGLSVQPPEIWTGLGFDQNLFVVKHPPCTGVHWSAVECSEIIPLSDASKAGRILLLCTFSFSEFSHAAGPPAALQAAHWVRAGTTKSSRPAGGEDANWSDKMSQTKM